jgi:hypothetical protein
METHRPASARVGKENAAYGVGECNITAVICARANARTCATRRGRVGQEPPERWFGGRAFAILVGGTGSTDSIAAVAGLRHAHASLYPL